MRRQLRMRDRLRSLVALGLGALALVGVGAVVAVVAVGSADDGRAAAPPAAAAVGTLAVLAGATWWAWARRFRRSVVDPVEALAAVTHEAATIRLPHTLDSVRAGADVGAVAVPTLAIDADGEIGDVASAFDEVQRRAVLLVSEQARLRRYVEQTLVDLGRRNQALLTRTLDVISELEANEHDPAALEDLFRLDHLATRMRRNAESLLVLAGTDPPRTWSEPLDVADVVRAALAEIEAYDRVDLDAVDPESIEGRAVAGLAHLLAELLENATSFSPPDSRVGVLGRREQTGYRITIVDRGVGMTPAQLAEANRRVGEAAPLELVPSRLLGLSVVGRLAPRLGVRVLLLAGPDGGTVAEVVVPTEVLAGAPAPVPDAPPVVVGETALPAASDAEPPPVRADDLLPGEPAAHLAPEPEPVQVQAHDVLPARVRGAHLPDLGPARAPNAPATRDPDGVRSALAGLQFGTTRGRTVAGGGLVRRVRGAHLPYGGPPRRLRRHSAVVAGDVASRLAAFQRGVARARGATQPVDVAGAPEPADPAEPNEEGT